MDARSNPIEILCTSINKKLGVLAVGTTYGYVVFSIDKFTPFVRCKRTFGRGIGAIDVLGKSNILCVVGGGFSPYNNRSTVEILDDKTRQSLFKKDYKDEIKKVRISERNLVISTINHCVVLSYRSQYDEVIIPTYRNDNGLMILCEENNMVMTVGDKVGFLTLYNIRNRSKTDIKCFKKSEATSMIINSNRIVAVFCKSKMRFVFINSDSGLKCSKLKYQSSIPSIQSFQTFMNQVILGVYVDDTVSFFDLIRKRDKIFSFKLNAFKPICSFINDWDNDSITVSCLLLCAQISLKH